MLMFVAKLSIALISLFASGTLTGMYLARHTPLAFAHENGHLNLAAKPVIVKLAPIVPQAESSGGSAGAVIAVHTERLDNLSRENQASIDDRRLIHDEIARSQERETTHFNAVVNRLDVDEAQAATILKIGGIIFGLLQGIPIILTILEYRNRRSGSPLR